MGFLGEMVMYLLGLGVLVAIVSLVGLAVVGIIKELLNL